MAEIDETNAETSLMVPLLAKGLLLFTLTEEILITTTSVDDVTTENLMTSESTVVTKATTATLNTPASTRRMAEAKRSSLHIEKSMRSLVLCS